MVLVQSALLLAPDSQHFVEGEGSVDIYVCVCVCVWRHSFRLRHHPKQSLMGMETKNRVSKLSKIDDTVVQEIRPGEREGGRDREGERERGRDREGGRERERE